jgi:hypothetical protein
MVSSNTNGLKDFPFRSVLSLKLLIGYWKESIHSGKVPIFADALLEAINRAPELELPIEDLALIKKHQGLVDFLMTAVIPPAQSEDDLTAATIPFVFRSFYATRAFERKIDFRNLGNTSQVNIPGNQVAVGKTIHACLMILHQVYKVDLAFDKPILFTIRDPETGLDKVYKIEIGKQFFEIVVNGQPPSIDNRVLKFLTERIYDTDLLLQYLKPECFEFHGFMIFRMVDVTEQEMISSIKYDLLEKNAVTGKETFGRIQHKLRSIFNMPDIRLGLAFFDQNNNIVLNSSEDRDCWKSLAGNNETGIPCDNYNGSIYERSWSEKRYITIEDLDQYPFKTVVENTLLANGVKNILLAPLLDDGETIGMLELASPAAGKLNPISVAKVEHALPMFTAAVKRVKEEMATEVRALIQEECTNIHPSVQWRFFEAGTNLLNKRRMGEKAQLEDIIFKDVFPLFGLADVRNSSLERNAAIQHDLQENLGLVKALLRQLHDLKKLPLLDEIMYKTEKQLDKLSGGLASGDESNVLEFLKEEVNPLIDHFAQGDTGALINEYRQFLDPVFGVVYKRRKAFEESLGMINGMISNYLDEAERPAQEMFPHYFEKYQTDGVEYTLYLGSSLVRDRAFDPFYLKNFRLWQLMLMCEIDRKMEVLKPSLKTSLDITQLILVHDQPLSIRFRPDEKQFDVDGAYDIRYEIVKKRIDKAYIKHSGERLTQPGKIAVVYNQMKIEDEYRRYFEYLAAKHIIHPDVEQLELEELPGATGLKALRISVLRDQKIVPDNDPLLQNIREALSLH